MKAIKYIIVLAPIKLFAFVQSDPSHLNVATWNIRQATTEKLNNQINVKDESIKISDFIGRWISDRNVDILALQELYSKTNTTTHQVEMPLDIIMEKLPSNFKVLLGKPIRATIKRGDASEWREYCPIFYNTEKVDCSNSDDNMIAIGHDLALDEKGGNYIADKTYRKVNWAYCTSKEGKSDFVISCVHTNYKSAEQHVLGVPAVIDEILNKKVSFPEKLRSANRDFIFAGDFNLDRRSARVFKNWGTENVIIDGKTPTFPKKTRWKKSAFSKLKDIYTFSEAKDKSTDIYDDVANSEFMNESLIEKYIDPLIDDYFIASKGGKVDMKALLGLSDHLPVIATYKLDLDTD